ncbi:MFS transporter [Bradyrhizobium prioriisuperbiae]|uniref:MFS transporter n=1 Tax=Bradyrhizobium prioriisuperbiae TaxID=2854389 RepID=UPI00389964CD
MTTNTMPEAHVAGLQDEPAAAWSAIYAISLCTFVLIASEFLPMSLLSPIAHDLGLTEGQAGQAISVSGIFAVLASLSVTAVVHRLDRRHVLIGLTFLLAVSGSVVALATAYRLLLLGRALLGISIGGFWALPAASVMRLVPARLGRQTDGAGGARLGREPARRVIGADRRKQGGAATEERHSARH